MDGVEREDMLRIVVFAGSDKTIAGLRDAVLIRLMSDCLLRIPEAVAVNVGDLHKLTLRIKSSKTDQGGSGRGLVCRRSHTEVDRSLLHKGWDTKRGVIQAYQTGRLMSRADGSRRSRLGGLSQPVPKLRVLKGFISGHSLRVGSAVSLAQAGASVVDMQNAGRWKSPQMPAHYAKAELAETGSSRKVLLWEVISMRRLNKYHRGFNRLWLVCSCLLAFAFVGLRRWGGVYKPRIELVFYLIYAMLE